MKIIDTNILNVNFEIEENNHSLPLNIYAIKVLNLDENTTFEIAIKHNGYCPNISSEYEESKFSEYLCNLEYTLIDEYYKQNNMKKPKSYYSICEVMTNEKGDLYRFSKTTN